MDKIYEVWESSSSNEVPESLQAVLSAIPDDACNQQNLFLGLVYIMTLESGFEPCEDRTEPSQAKPCPLFNQQKFKYDSQKILRWSKKGFPKALSISEELIKWTFSVGGLGNLFLNIEFLQSTSLLALVSAAVKGSSFSASHCFNLSQFVPDPHAQEAHKKFKNLPELSIKLKSMLWLTKIEILSLSGVQLTSAHECLPQFVLENIARHLPERKDGLRLWK